jgi:squalene-associated FAD-dependent desaturase
MKVAVVGAGWAGLSAAVYLHRYGQDVVVFEAARTLGGRARSTHSPKLKATIDNGQHILLGGYSETLKLFRDLGINPDSHLLRQPLSLRTADGSFSLNAPSLPAPFHLLAALVKGHGLSLKERAKLLASCCILRLYEWKTPPGQTVAQWLTKNHQSEHIVRQFWQPLCLAALNTPIDRACAQLFAYVLRDSLGGPSSDSNVLIPSVDLSEIWAEHLPAQIDIRYGRVVKKLIYNDSHTQIDNEEFDNVVLATNAYAAHRLLKTLPPSETGKHYLELLQAFEYLPIATITLQLERPWKLPYSMLMLRDNPARLQFGQWLFDRSTFMQDPTKRKNSSLTVVISDARALSEHAHDEIVAAVITQIEEQTVRFPAMPKVTGHELICEKRATFAAIPNLQRPATQTPWPGIWAAGDWTNTRYPAVLEGAVRSGKHAATLVTRDF